MRLASLATLAALVVCRVSANPVESKIISPSGIPATSAPPIPSISFDTSGSWSLFTSPSSLISSMTSPISLPLPTLTSHTASATGSTITTIVTSTPTATAGSTSGAYSWGDVRSGVLAGAVAGSVAVLWVI